MNGHDIMFYLLAIGTLVSAIMAVSTRQIFRSAIYLLFALLGIAGIYFWMEYNFIAAVQIVVYAGGIAVLIIFSILLTHQSGEKMPMASPGRKILGSLIAFCGFALVLLQLAKHEIKIQAGAPPPEMSAIGEQLLNTGPNGMALPFELISMLLLAAMIGCIVIAMRSSSTDVPILDSEAKPENINPISNPKTSASE